MLTYPNFLKLCKPYRKNVEGQAGGHRRRGGIMQKGKDSLLGKKSNSRYKITL